MLALHATSHGSPEEKLAWAFRMYDVDGNGSIDFNEMKRELRSSKSLPDKELILQSGVSRVRDDGHRQLQGEQGAGTVQQDGREQ